MSYDTARLVGMRLREERKKRGWTLQDVTLKKDGKITMQTCSNIETGSTLDPSFRLLCMLGKLYGLTPNDLAELYGYWDAADSTPHLTTT